MRLTFSNLSIPLVAVSLFFLGEIASGQEIADNDNDSLASVRQAILDMGETFGDRYDSDLHLRKLDVAAERFAELLAIHPANHPDVVDAQQKLQETIRTALLANPLLDFDRLLVIRREPEGGARRPKGTGYGLGIFLGLPRQSSWQQDTIPRKDGWVNDIAILSNLRSKKPSFDTFYRPDSQRLVGDIELDYDANKLLMSIPDDRLNWQIYQLQLPANEQDAENTADATSSAAPAVPVQLTPDDQDGIHNFDATYLPDGRIIFESTAPLQGVPCNASVSVAMTYRMDADGSNIRQLCFDQDHNYCPTVLNDGRVMYLRWEYTDIPHVWGRYLFTMNPDGTGQREFYGSGSYWPNGMFYARAVPGHATRVIAIVTGHHVGRVGELVLLDPSKGRNSTNGVVHRFIDHGRPVEPLIEDRLTQDSWPKFLHPYPLSDKYFIVSSKPTPDSLWGIYLVDIFDNMTLLAEQEDIALLEPIPIQSRKRPPIIPDRSDPTQNEAVVYLEDIYQGPGLAGVPRGDVKRLRLFTYNFAYQRMAGIVHRVGADGPWEPKRILGTVPVEPDGSAIFRVPARVPISVQPLDADGKALQLMRSWMTAMPGEVVSCVGCHESQNSGPPSQSTLAARKMPSEITPWYGPTRGFSFRREVQPVLDRYCVGCHQGKTDGERQSALDLRADPGYLIAVKNQKPDPIVVEDNQPREELFKKYGGVFDASYFALRRFVRVGGLESDIRLLAPGEFGVDTQELIQILKRGHYGVKLDREAWERLYTWIDLNAPCHGTWQETAGTYKTSPYRQRRLELAKLYGGIVEDYESDVTTISMTMPVEPLIPEAVQESTVEIPTLDDWPFDREEATRRQMADGVPAIEYFDLGDGVGLEMVYIPAGRFIMGDTTGRSEDAQPRVVTIDHPFWIGRYEITNQQFARFNAKHESRYEHKGSWSFWEHHLGWPLDDPQQPVVRVSQSEAADFCRWLSEETGKKFDLPTEEQWEYACRAGSADAFSFGPIGTDFTENANMADTTLRQLAYDTDGRFTTDLTPRADRLNDGRLVTAPVGQYRPNPWRLHDMHGNVWEWTRSTYTDPRMKYLLGDEKDNQDTAVATSTAKDDNEMSGRPIDDTLRVVRGGSWRDRPHRCSSAMRLGYPQWQKVYNVGFRVVYQLPETTEDSTSESSAP